MSTAPIDLALEEGPLASGDWLEAHLDHPRVRVLDVRGRHPSAARPPGKRTEYGIAHVPGAAFVDWTVDFVDPDDPVPYQVAPPAPFAACAAAHGVGDGDLIVTYDDYFNIFASRVAWAFRYYGAQARVLDGGWPSWLEEGRPLSAEPAPTHAATFTPRPQPDLRRSIDQVEDAFARGALVVDARPRHLYLGEPEPTPGMGHIPGSRCLPYPELVDGATVLFASPAAIRRLLRGAGIDPDAPARPSRPAAPACPRRWR
jgi:thiosulfate/3-mercaptopyruvate sulfurtransferase